jgi:ubiquinone/menaquinone biosynthesis C-methylase UbiE
MLVATPKNWDAHVVHAEDVARGRGFRHLRDRIIELADPRPGDTAVDVGAGTGLLTLALAHRGVQVWAVDISPSMCAYLRAKAASAGSDTVETVVASAASLPLVDGCADLLVSNYCLHHLSETDKRRALAEVHRVLRPGGRLVFGDMMFGLGLGRARDRKVVGDKIAAMLRKGPAGVVRLAKNGARVLSRRWERPARAGWWATALNEAGFVDVAVEELPHEGGIAVARRP